MLEPVGLNEIEEAIYLALLKGRGSTVVDLVREVGADPRRTRAAIARLKELGFVTHRHGSPARLSPVQPDVAVGALVARRRQELGDVERDAMQLSAAFPEELRTHPDELVEVVVGRRAVAARFAQMAQRLEREMLVLDRPPYAQVVSEANGPELDALARGISVRGIYSPEAFELPGAFAQARRAEEAGEQARVHADVPMKLVVVDATTAMMPMTENGDVESSLVIHSPMVVAALVRLFELLWRQACPLVDWPRAGDERDGVDHELLVMLGTGMKDEAIARELGISVRTLGRRIAGLLEKLGARTRFQAGLQAFRRGGDRLTP
ncbi:helix-turn-helix transcriptional regulator [Rugosimonospora africana]|uniref:Transcriptional regulator n=1 Tax=Rugosimonospora africana TaxID=556532 RepID=A0A8J3VWU2_9ACTN|nr:LuxR family transcriptional regulator [Rugosimonospora africana]GIH21249.1 transcriptional regulator [Rugosimonospora africana]